MAGDLAALTIDLQPGDRLLIGGQAVVQFVHKSGRTAKLLVSAPRDVLIKRERSPGLGDDVPRVAQSVSVG